MQSVRLILFYEEEDIFRSSNELQCTNWERATTFDQIYVFHLRHLRFIPIQHFAAAAFLTLFGQLRHLRSKRGRDRNESRPRRRTPRRQPQVNWDRETPNSKRAPWRAPCWLRRRLGRWKSALSLRTLLEENRGSFPHFRLFVV